MKFRTYTNTDLRVSEVGFGLWTISTGWWGRFTEGEAIALMHKAFDLGITLFDAADTYGNGLSEELIAKAFPKQRDQITIATKVGYDFVHHGQARGRGQREIPQDFSPEAIERATDAALKRLKTDHVDLLQLHNIRMEQVYDDALWKTLEKLKSSGKIRYYGIALGPAIGWLYEGMNCIRERDITSVQHIYNMLEQHPGHAQLAAQRNQEDRQTPFSRELATHSWTGGIALVAGRRSRGFDAAEYLQPRTADRIRESARLPAAGFGRSRQDRQSLFRKLRR